ncbi:hypothetical protein POVCU2_0027560 [Plasmodium ovale curtisi]|uniref:PIR Superfamily Protein n=1 Tax=Plasmodium ovale curtisi TaxID=864141 RepID=A0A1A8XEB4_PLAOA|nr:hypothetical protein POVCU2_0027560 [Plasmodium ovale curtisi]SBT02215.1 hypothetical protein POVCU1_074310 [Plasmodium ovale curtisi]
MTDVFFTFEISGITKNDLPSKKYKIELENGIHYEEVEQNMEDDRLTIKLEDFNHILDFMLKRIKAKEITNSYVFYKLIKLYINNATEIHLEPWDGECERKPKFPDHSDNIENMKKIDNLCEDIAYIEENISEIHRYYSFNSFDDFDSTVKKLKFKCQDISTASSITKDQGEIETYSGRNTSIIAVTTLSGILSSFFLLYKTTSFSSILYTLIRKKIKFRNNLSHESYHETLEDVSESSDSGTHNILYNSIGDF